MATKNPTWVNRRLLPYGGALAITVAASVWREVMVRNLGDPLPLYITFYPAVMIVSLVFGLRQGLLATLYSVLLVAYWNLPREEMRFAGLTEIVGMVLFAGMCVCMAVVVDAYRRNRDRAAAYEKQAAVQKTDDVLRRSEERCRSLVVATAQVVWMADAHGLMVDDLHTWQAFTGMTLEQIRGWGWIQSLHPDDRERAAKEWQDCVPNRPRYETEYRIRRHDGQYCHMAVRGVPVVGEDGEVREWVGMCTDITERKQAEGEIRKQAALLDLVPAATMVRDMDSKIVFWNRGAEELYGWSKSEALGKVTHELLHARYPQPVVEIESSVLRGKAWEGELVHRTRNGKRITVASRWAPQYDDKRQAIGFLEINVDITARKQVEQEVQRCMHELERSNAELQDFASIASHDLQEPLRKVIAFGEHLKDHSGDKLDEQGLDFLARMQNAAQRMSGLIEALLQYSRVSTRAQPFQPVDLLGVVFGVLADMEERIAKSHARIEVAAMPKVMADPMQVRQLMQNLVANALKFQQEGTTPHVVIEGRTTDHGGCEISVRDNGIGFEEKYLERIFRPFQRLHGRSEYEGSGMGLAICRKVVARHGGTITAHSRPGEGSTFVVTLPAVKITDGERRETWAMGTKPSSSESCSPKMMTTITS